MLRWLKKIYLPAQRLCRIFAEQKNTEKKITKNLKTMKKTYRTPEFEISQICVEQGIAASGDGYSIKSTTEDDWGTL